MASRPRLEGRPRWGGGMSPDDQVFAAHMAAFFPGRTLTPQEAAGDALSGSFPGSMARVVEERVARDDERVAEPVAPEEDQAFADHMRAFFPGR